MGTSAQCTSFVQEAPQARNTSIRLLARQPEISREAEDIKPGYKKFSQGSHIIFYRAGTESRIVVIRTLHNSVDVDQHL
ncbi:type II toxin-antitoxin system RelE/ParE family toxin [Marinobacter sp.]|uniref:type II toxin-antitoxin system RelE/ParE family toxin n=1 Tax=Marinobacter sp. TaxID=50741 RepID=UPI001B44A3DC|nr:type II toxin-antitoxin system RelE/ParE family toxin [Marinobacter sp.]